MLMIRDEEVNAVGQGCYYKAPYSIFYKDGTQRLMTIEGFEADVMEGDDCIEISLDEFISLINNMEHRDMSDEVDELSADEKEMLENLRKEFFDLGIEVSISELYETHLSYSDSLCASWINVGYAADEIYCLLQGISDARNFDNGIAMIIE